MDPEIKYHRNRQSHIRNLKIKDHFEVHVYCRWTLTQHRDRVRGEIYGVWDGHLRHQKRRTEEDGEEEDCIRFGSLCKYESFMFFEHVTKSFWLGHKTCLFNVLQSKKVGIPTEDGGVSIDVHKRPNTLLMCQHHLDIDVPKWKLDGRSWTRW